MLRVLYVVLVAIEVVWALAGVIVAIAIRTERRRLDRNQERVIDRLDRIERRLMSADEVTRRRDRRRRQEREKWEAFERYGIEEGT